MTLRERHGMSANMIKQIMRLLNEGRTQQEIADLFGCSREAISSIATGRAYKRYINKESNDV
jgi:transcriptional regulator